jgi:cell division cycle protein 37
VINIRVPPVIQTDAVIEGLEEIEDLEERENARKELIEQAQQARAVFDGFPEEMRKALETGKLDEVNKVLGEMPLDEAEAMVELFSEANILGVEKDVIDPNTDEGKQRLEEIRESAKQDKEQEQQQAERTEDPE